MNKWTKEPPTVQGWYWWRDKTEEVIFISKFDDGINAYLDGEFYPVLRLGGEWWPERIKEPQ